MYCHKAIELKRNKDYSWSVQLYQKVLKHFYANYQQYGGGPAYAAHDEYNKCFPSLTLKYDEWSIGDVYYALGKAFYLVGEYDKAAASYLLYINSFIKDDYDMDYALKEDMMFNDPALKYHVSLNSLYDIFNYPTQVDVSRDIVRHLGHGLRDKYASDTDIAIKYKNALSGDSEAIKIYTASRNEEELFERIGNDAWVEHIAYLCDIDISVPVDPDIIVKINPTNLLKSSLLFRNLILD